MRSTRLKTFLAGIPLHQPQVFFPIDEEVFSSGSVKYNGQVIGVVVAETKYIAEKAAKLVHVKYNNVKNLLLTSKKPRRLPVELTWLAKMLEVLKELIYLK